jgi:hypothetical protein
MKNEYQFFSVVTKLSVGDKNDWPSQWPRGLRLEPSSPARTLGSWIRIPFEAWMSECVYSVCAVLCAGSGLGDGLIPVPRSPTDCV